MRGLSARQSNSRCAPRATACKPASTAKPLFDVEDNDRPLTGGGVGFVVEEGRIMSDAMTVSP